MAKTGTAKRGRNSGGDAARPGRRPVLGESVRVVGVRLPSDLHRRLRLLAADRDTTVSELIRIAAEDFTARNRPALDG